MKAFNVLDRNQNIHSDYVLEASAGTGKTFSIENLVVRLLLEGDSPLELEQILVVTFTRESAHDLKVRIRRNIEKSIEDLQKGNPADYLMAFIEKDEAAHAQKKLRKALFSFDQAQIFTIHAFCSRILRENIFEGDIAIDSMKGDRQTEDTQILGIIRDFFRTTLSISPAQLEIVLKKNRGSIENLENALLRYAAGGSEIVSTPSFLTYFSQFQHAMQQLDLNTSYILEDFEILESCYKKMTDSRAKVERFASLCSKQSWEKEDFDQLIKDGLHLVELFDPENQKVKAKLPAREQLYYPELIPTLKELYAIVEKARNYPLIFAHMASACQKMVWKYLGEEEKFRFDDLLKMVLNATKNDSFNRSIQRRYRAAIVDEFQDTDPIQWEIFKRLFHKKSALYLVGDPKQSIYAFRQADIYTYLDAAKTLGEEHQASLDTNFRSQPSLIKALNALFDQNRTPDWISLPRIRSSLIYPQVKASPKVPESGWKDVLHFFILEDSEGKGKQEDQESAYFFPFIRQEVGSLKISLSKIAVLVKDHRQAERLGAYLEEHSIPCSLQRSQSLLESAAYPAWKELLQAVMNPRDESSIKKALGGEIFGWTEAEIRTLEEIQVTEKVLAKFYSLRSVLYTEGISSLYENLLKSEGKSSSLAEEILSRRGGEQFFNDLQQIAELLIEEEVRVQATPEALLRYLNTFPYLDINQDESLKKRRDRDQEAIRILTMHSSKGLEFDVVFALGLVNRTPKEELLISINQKLVAVSDPQSEDYQNYLKELDAEKMRQLYVAMTRAKHRLYVPVLYGKKDPELGMGSPMELFLTRLGTLDAKSLLNFITTQTEMGYSLLNTMEFSFTPVPSKEKVSLKAPLEIHLNPTPQYLLSFTSLTKSFGKEEFGTDRGIRSPQDFENSFKSIHTLPSGSLTGVFIHEIFEKLPFNQLHHSETIKAYIQTAIDGSLFENWGEIIYQLVENTVKAPLQGFCLEDIDPQKIYRETEFIYPHDKGFLKGVIDFAFEHKGKYYLIDWKTNWLGPQGEDYHYTKLEAAMQKHHYLLQARIYKEALKKYLHLIELRPFEECFGGIFYLFIRGLDPHIEGQGVYYGNG